MPSPALHGRLRHFSPAEQAASERVVTLPPKEVVRDERVVRPTPPEFCNKSLLAARAAADADVSD